MVLETSLCMQNILAHEAICTLSVCCLCRMSCDMKMRLRKPPSMHQITNVKCRNAVCGQRKMLRPVSKNLRSFYVMCLNCNFAVIKIAMLCFGLVFILSLEIIQIFFWKIFYLKRLVLKRKNSPLKSCLIYFI